MLVENLARDLAGAKDTQVQMALAEPSTIEWVQKGCGAPPDQNPPSNPILGSLCPHKDFFRAH